LKAYEVAIFKEICKQYLWELNKKGKAAITFTDLDRWWGNDPKNKRGIEIDIMGIADDRSALFCECKWTNEKADKIVLETLLEHSKLFHYTNVHLYLFAKTGFTKDCMYIATELGNAKLVTFADIMKI
jgi:hypothetical protein